ncbi:hypothetical protein AB0H00_13980 [Nocardia sp. NPDC023852]|uniref:hypothetical protein n=1 Tax=Nocardia sp. NPDC023852 TaxID=3154697 RepID=UPI0033FDA90E
MESDIRRYRRRRERQREAERHRPKQLSKQEKEVEDILAFARIWAPFGGAPEEETFIKFGICPTRFIERLWQILTEMSGDKAELAELRQAYPRYAVAVTAFDSVAPTISDGQTIPGCAP